VIEVILLCIIVTPRWVIKLDSARVSVPRRAAGGGTTFVSAVLRRASLPVGDMIHSIRSARIQRAERTLVGRA
jgi:hypothetical protein